MTTVSRLTAIAHKSPYSLAKYTSVCKSNIHFMALRTWIEQLFKEASLYRISLKDGSVGYINQSFPCSYFTAILTYDSN